MDEQERQGNQCEPVDAVASLKTASSLAPEALLRDEGRAALPAAAPAGDEADGQERHPAGVCRASRAPEVLAGEDPGAEGLPGPHRRGRLEESLSLSLSLSQKQTTTDTV